MKNITHGLKREIDVILKLFQPNNNDGTVLRDGHPSSWCFDIYNLEPWFPSWYGGDVSVNLPSLDRRFTDTTSLWLSHELCWKWGRWWHSLPDSSWHLSRNRGRHILATRVRRLGTSEACGGVTGRRLQGGNDKSNFCHGIGKVGEGSEGDLGINSNRSVGIFRFASPDLPWKSRMIDWVYNPTKAMEKLDEFCRLVAQWVLWWETWRIDVTQAFQVITPQKAQPAQLAFPSLQSV